MKRLALLLLLSTLAACGRIPGNIDAKTADVAKATADDVVVIAVVDSSINPYHWDYLSAKMPEHALPLDTDPAEWLPGHPGASAFKSYEALQLTLPVNDPDANTDELAAADAGEWSKILISEDTDNSDVHMYWMPGTKIVGHVVFSPGLLGDPFVTFATGRRTGPLNTYAATSHGVGTSSVAAGAIHGTCPNCVLVYVHGTGEQASRWVEQQDWIDVQSNSWGYSTVYRERVYAGSDTEAQRAAVERGQSIFFSAGNGQENAFVTPNTTLFSSQEGPDWIITVGAISPGGSSYSGHGKPSDVASIGSGYPSANNNGARANGEGNFSGTSNATPVMAGIYGEALHRVRKQLGPGSRLQSGGVIARGAPGCQAANPQCALADGELTVHEMREALFRAAQYTPQGTNVGGVVTLPGTESVAEAEMLSEGHGSYYGRLNDDEHYETEIQRVVGYIDGSWFTEQDAAQRDFMIAKSVCRQAGWGTWEHGYAQLGPAPAADPQWPVRSFFSELCPIVLPAAVTAERALVAPFQ
jgi:hypothetical protein